MPISRPEKGKKRYKRTKNPTVSISASIPPDIFRNIKESNVSINKAVNDALEHYFRDHYRSKLETALFTLYEVLFDIEKLKDLGKIGSIECTPDHLLQIESYKEAIKILENSPLFFPDDLE